MKVCNSFLSYEKLRKSK